MKTYYDVKPKKGDSFRVRATSYQHAAEIAGRKINGRKSKEVHRVTGTSNLSGWFQSYNYLKKYNAMTSVGSSFHVA